MRFSPLWCFFFSFEMFNMKIQQKKKIERDKGLPPPTPKGFSSMILVSKYQKMV